MPRPIAFSLICAIYGSLSPTPRGIERVDFGYISYLLDNWEADCFGVLPTPWGMRYFSRERILKGRDQLAAYWGEAAPVGDDRIYSELLRRLCHPDLTQHHIALRADPAERSKLYGRPVSLLLRGGVGLGQSTQRLPERTIYMDVGHTGIAHTAFLSWLKRRPDIDPVFMVHDAIPLERPDLVQRGSVKQHRRIMTNSATYASAIITPTETAAASVRTHLSKLGNKRIPLHPLGLPVEDTFSPAALSTDTATCRPYFVVCGAIERRKNQYMLLSVWRELISAYGADAPYLVLAGRPGFESDFIIDELRQSAQLGTRVLIASGLSTPAMARLMAGARALLMPSFAEGFGLPPVEALSVGTPAILSDIPAHREATGDLGIYLDPNDPPAWRRAVEQFTGDTDRYRTEKGRISGFRPLRWSSYMARVDGALREL